MNSKRLFHLWIIFAIIGILPYGINAQEKGRIGLIAKAQLIPHIGISYNISEDIILRPSFYLEYIEGDFNRSIMTSLSILLKVSSDKSLSTYIGSDVTYHGFMDKFFIGIILGTEYNIHKKVSLFGEFGPSLQIGDGLEGIVFLNTGIGIIYYLN